ncbi:hypothetical protein JOM56_015457 [Amanita muscaria]
MGPRAPRLSEDSTRTITARTWDVYKRYVSAAAWSWRWSPNHLASTASAVWSICAAACSTPIATLTIRGRLANLSSPKNLQTSWLHDWLRKLHPRLRLYLLSKSRSPLCGMITAVKTIKNLLILYLSSDTVQELRQCLTFFPSLLLIYCTPNPNTRDIHRNISWN